MVPYVAFWYEKTAQVITVTPGGTGGINLGDYGSLVTALVSFSA